MKKKSFESQEQPTEEIDLGLQEFSDPRANEIMEMLRKKATTEFGVTVVGPYVTLRFRKGKDLVQVSMQVTSITDSGVRELPDPDWDK